MAKVVYTAEATVTGGREHGHGKTSDGALEVQLRAPTEGGGTNPEQLFAVGYAACFEGALGVGVALGELAGASHQPTLMPMERAVPATCFLAASRSLAFRSGILVWAISTVSQKPSRVRLARRILPGKKAKQAWRQKARERTRRAIWAEAGSYHLRW